MKSYKQGVLNKPRLDGFDTVRCTGCTPTFWPWTRNCDFCQSGCMYWGPIGPFGAVSYCASKLIIYRYPLWVFVRNVHFTILVDRSLLRLYFVWAFGRFVRCSTLQVLFCSFSDFDHTIGRACYFSCSSTVSVVRPLVSRLFRSVGHTTDYFFFRSFHRFLVVPVRYLTRWAVSNRAQRLLPFNICIVCCLHILFVVLDKFLPTLCPVNLSAFRGLSSTL